MTDDQLAKTDSSPAGTREPLDTLTLPREPAHTLAFESFDTPNLSKPAEKYLLDRVSRHDPAVSVVAMNEAKTIRLDREREHTLFTFGLCGCDSVLVLTHQPGGTSLATLSHFDPLHGQIHPIVLTRELLEHKKATTPDTTHSVLVLTPAKWVKRDEKYEQVPKNPDRVATLFAATKQILGDSVNEKYLPYSEKPLSFDQSTAFIIRSSPHSDHPIRYEAHGSHFGSLPSPKRA